MGGRFETLFQSLSGLWGYAFLFISSFVENIFPPLPGDTFVVLGAFLVARGQMAFLPAYASTLVGSVSGFLTCYAIGKRWGRQWFQSKHGRFFSQEHLDRVDRWFRRYGDWVLVFNRFLSGFRAVVSFAAGIAHMNFRKVLLFAFFSCLLWNGFLMGLGLYVGQRWAVVLHDYQRIVFGFLVLLLVSWWLKSVLFKRKMK